MTDLLYSDNLDTILKSLNANGVETTEFELAVSIKSLYYSGDKFTLLCKSLKSKILDYTKHQKIDKFKIFIGDSLNKHTFYYRYASDYLKINNINIIADSIPSKIKEKLKSQSLKSSINQGVKWFASNLEAINELMPENHKLNKDFNLNDKITTLYEGDENIPKIEVWRYDYYLNHPEYKETEKALREVCDLKDSVIERAFQYELDYYIERIKSRGEKIEFEELLRQQSYKYLFDETVSFIIKHREQNNLIEFYFGGGEPKPTLTFRGKKAQSDPIIQKYLQGPLKGADQRKFVSIKMVEE